MSLDTSKNYKNDFEPIINYPISSEGIFTMVGSPSGDNYILIKKERNAVISGLSEFRDDHFINPLFTINEGNNRDSTFTGVEFFTKYVSLLQIRYCNNLEYIKANQATFCNGALQIYSNKKLNILQFNNLVEVIGSVLVQLCPELVTVSFPKLKYILQQGQLSIDIAYQGITTKTKYVLFAELELISGLLSCTGMQYVEQFYFPKLRGTQGAITLSNFNTLTELKFPKLENSGGAITITGTALTNVEIGSVEEGTFTLKECMGNISITGMTSLNLSCVTNLLRNIAHMDGVNEGTLLYTNRTITLKATAENRVLSGSDYTKITAIMLNTITYV